MPDPARYRDLAPGPEIAAVPGGHVDPRAEADASGRIDAARAANAIGRPRLRFGVLDRRGPGPGPHVPTRIAKTVLNAGEGIGDALRAEDLARGEAGFTLNARPLLSGRAMAPQDPAEAVVFVLSHLARRGFRARNRMVILCGAHHPPVPLGSGTGARFTLADKAVSLSISD